MGCCKDWMNWWEWRAYKNTRSVWPSGITVALEIQISGHWIPPWFCGMNFFAEPCLTPQASPLVPTPKEDSCASPSYLASLLTVYSRRPRWVLSSPWKRFRASYTQPCCHLTGYSCRAHTYALLLCLPREPVKSRTMHFPSSCGSLASDT